MAFCVYHWTTLRDTSRSDLLQGGEGWTYTVTNSTRSTSQSEVQWQVLETMGLSAVQSRTTLQDISESDLVCAKGLQNFWSTFPPNSLSSVNTIPIGIWDQVTGLLSWCSLQASVSFRLQSNIFIVVAWLERDHLQLMKRMCVDGNGLNRLFYHCFLVYQLCSGYRNSTLRKRPLWNIATVLNKKIRKTKLPVDRFL